jgi:hypothetical protein
MLNEVIHAAVHSAVSWTVGFLMGAFVVRGLRSLLHKIADQLDTATPGGLTDVKDAVDKLRVPPTHHR